jgi:hypothetical protein
MLIAVLKNGDVQVIDSRATPVLLMLDMNELDHSAKLHAEACITNLMNKGHFGAPTYPNTEHGIHQRIRDQRRLLEFVSRHETFKQYVGEAVVKNAESSGIIVPRKKIIT